MIRKTVIVSLSAFVLSGCVQGAFDFPVPLVTPSGAKGFGMNGFVQYTHDETKARAEIEATMRAACGGDVKILKLDMEHADSMVGVPHLHYTAVAECVSH